MADLPAGKSKLIQYLNEAYGTERRLEVALQAHLALATRPTYKKRLKEHLTETKRHAREVSKRIKQLGGKAEAVDLPGPDSVSEVAEAAVAGAQRAVALVQGPLHALRGTGEEEKQLKNAKTEYASEAEEIATYTAIITVAEALGDRDTAKLARAILREEERMRSFLEKEIPRMASAVVKAEVPSDQRARTTQRAKPTTRTRPAKSATSKSATSTTRVQPPKRAQPSKRAQPAKRARTSAKRTASA
jgi:ferritin-like metal-binding protein YciE